MYSVLTMWNWFTDGKRHKCGLAALLWGLCLTLCAAAPADSLASAEALRLERGIVNTRKVFVPQGKWLFGGYASYSTHKNDRYDFAVIEGIQSDGYTFKLSPMGGYALRNNMTVGARFLYNRSLLKVNGGSLSLGGDDGGLSLSADYYYSLKHSYQAAVFWRQYIPLTERIALFNELTLSAGGHQSKFASGIPVDGTYEDGFELSLGASPGLAAFVNRFMAVEVNVGVMGLNFERARQVQNQVATAGVTKSYMNFNINLLAVRLGVVFYL